MTCMDHTVASIDTRQLFSFPAERQEELYARLRAMPAVMGSAIISTCNRTELWLSCEEDAACDPFAVLCALVDVDPEEYQGQHFEKFGDEALELMRTVVAGF